MRLSRLTIIPAVVLAGALASPVAAEKPKPRAVLENKLESVLCVAYAPDGKSVATAAMREDGPAWFITIWDAATGKELRSIKAGKNQIDSVCFSPDGKGIAASGEITAAARIYDVATGKERLVIPYPKGDVGAFEQVGFSPDGKTLAAAACLNGGFVGLYDAATGKLLHGMVGVRFAFSPDGKTLARGGQSPKIRLWDLATSKERDPIESRMNGVVGLAVSPDGKTLVACGNTADESDNALPAWGLATGKAKPSFKGHTQRTVAVAVSPDGRTVASAGADGTVRLWDAATGKEFASFEEPHPCGLAFSPDGKTLASADGDRKVRLWAVPVRKKEK